MISLKNISLFLLFITTIPALLNANDLGQTTAEATYPDQAYVIENIIKPMAEEAKIDINVSISNQNHPKCPELDFINGKYTIILPKINTYPEEECKGFLGHIFGQILCDNVNKVIRINYAESIIKKLPTFVTPIVLIATQIFTQQFPITPFKVRALIALAAAPMAFAQFKLYQLRTFTKDADKKATETLQKFEVGKSIIATLNFMQSINLNNKRIFILSEMQKHSNPIVQKAITTWSNLFQVNQFGDNVHDKRHPWASTRIQDINDLLASQKQGHSEPVWQSIKPINFIK